MFRPKIEVKYENEFKFRPNKRAVESITFYSLVSSFALRASLIALSPFILITRPANRECTFITGNKRLSIHCNLKLISTNLTNLPAQFLYGSHLLKIKYWKCRLKHQIRSFKIPKFQAELKLTTQNIHWYSTVGERDNGKE